jgi:type VI secretion system protein ImpM
VLVCDSNHGAVLWAGDSRLYRLRNHNLAQLTQDHCATKNSNIITRAVGATDELELDCERMNIRQGDVFLLCTDGLDKEISFAEIEYIMQTCTPENIANTLIAKALEYGARDNVSVIVISNAL